MRPTAVLMITALLVGGLVSCSEDEQTSPTTQDQTTVAVEDETTTTSAVDQATSPTSLPATSTVTVTVTNVEDAVGYDLAGVLYKGDGTGPNENVVGGFGAAVDTDPFSTTQIVRAPQPDLDIDSVRPESAWPYVTDDPAMLEPGTYYLQLWLGEPSLCCYYWPWLPAYSASLSGCGTVITVKEDEQLDIAVSIPPRSAQGNQIECPAG
jgi:hypothetical protein